MSHHRIVAWLLLGILLTVTQLLIQPPVTTAQTIAATCYGASCNGVDPGTAGCAADKVVAGQWGNGWYSVVRYYSPACHAYYAVAQNAYSHSSNNYVLVYMENNYEATVRIGYLNGYSMMWESGRGCNYNAGVCV